MDRCRKRRVTDAALKQVRLRWTAWGVWLLVFAIICGDVVRRPHQHDTMPTYRLASEQWWAGHDPYAQRLHDGFFYFPSAAFFFTPFTWGPFLTGEILWRVGGFGLFAYALVRLREFFLSARDPAPGRTFLILSLLAVPSAMASLRNAQFDLPLAALLVLGTAEAGLARWNRAAAWLCFAVALKPLAVVPLLLFGALRWKLIPRLAVGLLIVAAIPFLHENPAWVAHEYTRCVETMKWAAIQANEPRYSDLGALLSHLAITPPLWLKTVARMIFALAYLGLGAVAVRRLNRIDAAWTIGALSADYLMLFNPRTETCSYVFLAPFTASLAIRIARSPDRGWLNIALGFASLCFACDAIPYVHRLTDRWLKPLMAVLFLPVLIYFIFRNKSAGTNPRDNVNGSACETSKP
jgi:alpha-1,2-mannosyltransferase